MHHKINQNHPKQSITKQVKLRWNSNNWFGNKYIFHVIARIMCYCLEIQVEVLRFLGVFSYNEVIK